MEKLLPLPCSAHMLYEAKWLLKVSLVLTGMVGPVMLVDEPIVTLYLEELDVCWHQEPHCCGRLGSLHAPSSPAS